MCSCHSLATCKSNTKAAKFGEVRCDCALLLGACIVPAAEQWRRLKLQWLLAALQAGCNQPWHGPAICCKPENSGSAAHADPSRMHNLSLP